MQTFLPYEDFMETAKCLDTKRLNNQINEALIIHRTLTGYYPKGKGWANHPATKMWEGCHDLLAAYRDCLIVEWEKRAGKKRGGVGRMYNDWYIEVDMDHVPKWLGKEQFHRAHRSQLLLKDYEWYSQFGWKEKPGQYKYIWSI